MKDLKPCPFCGQTETVSVLSEREINCSLDEEYHDEDFPTIHFMQYVANTEG